MPSRRGRRARIARREERYWVDDDEGDYGPLSVATGGEIMAYILRDSGVAGVIGGSRRTRSRLSQSSPGRITPTMTAAVLPNLVVFCVVVLQPRMAFSSPF